MITFCPASNNATANNATAKRKRGGRKPGSKNKPKITVANCIPHVANLHPHVLQIPSGGDVAETICAFARGCRTFGVCILSASGPIAAAVLWEASQYPSTLVVEGNYNLLSFTATFLPGCSEGSLAMTLAGPHGQVVGGVVAGPVVAAGMVIVVAATFTPSAFHRFDALNNKFASMLPVVGGEPECGNSSSSEKFEAEKSNEDMFMKFIDSPPRDEGVDGKKLENIVKEYEDYIVAPTEAGGAFNGADSGVEENTVGVDGDRGGDGEGNWFDYEQFALDTFGADSEGCDDHFAMETFMLSGACHPLY